MNLFDLVAKLTLDSTEYVRGLHDAEGMVGKTGKAMGTLGKFAKRAFFAAEAAVTGFAATSVKTGMDFDKSMSQVAATMGKSMDEMSKDVQTVDLAWGTFTGNLRDYAQEMGAHTAFSAKQSADALNYMALAGYDTQTSMQMLPNVMNLAAAGAMDLARASDMVTDTQTAFGISLDRTTQMVDEMAKAASTGNTSVEQLGDAFLVVGGLARELNGGMVTLEDGTTATVDGIQEMEIALTAMANAGVKGSEAGTHMRNMLLKLSSPTSEGTKRLEEMGVKVFDTEGKMRSLSDIFGDLNTELGTMTQEEKIQAISDLFNTRDLASAEALLNAVGQDWDEIGASILDADGAAQKMADTQLDNLAGDITLFKSALEGAQIALNDGVSPALRSFVQEGTAGLSKFTEALKSGDMVGAAEVIGESFGKVITNVISKLPSLIAAGGALLKGAIQGMAAELPSALTSLYVALIGGMTNLADAISANFPNMLKSALTGLMNISAVIQERASTFVDAGLKIVKSIANGIIKNIPTIIQTVPTILTNFANIINNNAPKILATGVSIILNLAKGIIQAIPTLIANFPKIIESIIAVWSAVNWVDLGLRAVTLIGDGLKAAIKALPSILKSAGTAAWKAFKSLSWGAVGKTAVTLIVGGIKGVGKLILNGLKSAGQAALHAISNIGWRSVGSNIVKGIAGGIAAGAGIIINAAKNAAKSALNAAKNFLGISSPSKVFRDVVGKNISLGMAVGIEQGEKTVTKAMDALNENLAFPTIKPMTLDVSAADAKSYWAGVVDDNLRTMGAGQNVQITNYITVDGAENPEDFTERLVRKMKLDMRTA